MKYVRLLMCKCVWVCVCAYGRVRAYVRACVCVMFVNIITFELGCDNVVGIFMYNKLKINFIVTV